MTFVRVSTFVLASLLWVAVAACDAERDRPTGLSTPPPTTDVSVLAPEQEAAVKADSATFIVIQATGLIAAVEVVMSGAAARDTLLWRRASFGEPRDSVREAFDVKIPKLETGSHLQIRGVAEDAAGQRHVSQPVVVIVIDCDDFPIACRDL
ncbi:MAG: hypothetical protein PVI01_00430 [Gemmatimonadales bacterium]|jgi:hypothetical protein